MTVKDIIEELKTYFEKKSQGFKVSLAFLFGSYAGGFVKEESDIDVAVLFEKVFS